VLSLLVRHVEGDVPRLCVWEAGPNRCAHLPSAPNTRQWSIYRSVVMPDMGTTAISLFLYADVYVSRTRTTNEYADVRVVEVPAVPSFALLSDQGTNTQSSTQLVVFHNSYSNEWQASIAGQHVLVDGMLNGWIVPARSRDVTALYKPTGLFQAAQRVSLATLLGSLPLFVWPWLGRIRRYLRRRNRWSYSEDS
jgi:arabinofuranan 3-O-arabinosyltransferase